MDIHLSAYTGDIAGIKKCLEQHPQNLNSIFQLKHEDRVLKITPIFLAVIASQVDTVEFLLKQGAKTSLGENGENIIRWNFLTHPIHEKYQILGLLISQIGSHEKQSIFAEVVRCSLEEYKTSALALSTTLKNQFGPIELADEMDYYVLAGAIGTPPFHIEKLVYQSNDRESVKGIALGAAVANCTDTLLFLHDKFNVNFSHPVASQSWHTPLTVASLFNSPNVIRLLCEPKFHVDPSTPIKEGPLRGATPLILAASYGHLKGVEILCNQPNVKDDQSMMSGENCGRNAIYSAAINGNLPIVRLLCQKAGSDPARPLWIGPKCRPITPIQIAAYKGYHEILRNFALDPADIRDDFPKKWKSLSALHVALLLKRIDYVETLLEQSQGQNVSTILAVDGQGRNWPLFSFLFQNLHVLSEKKSQAVADILRLLATHGIVLTELNSYMLEPFFGKYLRLVPLEMKIERFFMEMPYLLDLITDRRMIPKNELLLHCDNDDYSVYGTTEQAQFTRDTVGAMLEKLMATKHPIDPALLAKLESLLASHDFTQKSKPLNNSDFRKYVHVINLVMDITTHLKHLESGAQGIPPQAPTVEWVLMK